MSMIDWQKDAVKHMWWLSQLGREQRGHKMTDEERDAALETLKKNVARYCRMASQMTAGQRGKVEDLDFRSIEHTGMAIIIQATDLCLDGVFGPMPDKIESDVE